MGQLTSNIALSVVIALLVLLGHGIAHLAPSTGTDILTFLAFYTILVQWIAFIHAGGFFGNERTERYYDLTGSVTIVTTVAYSIFHVNGELNKRQIILSSFAAIWGARLGWYLYMRILRNNGIDSRFTRVKSSGLRFLMNWTLQGFWVFISVLPVLIVNQSNKKVELGVLDYVGMSLWVVGFSTEVIADYQKITWQRSCENNKKFINIGLWSMSRHPNYFGEILLWFGIALSACDSASGPCSFIVFLSPIFVAVLLIYFSGIRLLEKKKNEELGKDDAYQEYKLSTPVLIPFIGRKGDADF